MSLVRGTTLPEKPGCHRLHEEAVILQLQVMEHSASPTGSAGSSQAAPSTHSKHPAKQNSLCSNSPLLQASYQLQLPQLLTGRSGHLKIIFRADFQCWNSPYLKLQSQLCEGCLYPAPNNFHSAFYWRIPRSGSRLSLKVKNRVRRKSAEIFTRLLLSFRVEAQLELNERQEQRVINKDNQVILFLSKEIRAECFSTHLNSDLKGAVCLKHSSSAQGEIQTFQTIKLLSKENIFF